MIAACKKFWRPLVVGATLMLASVAQAAPITFDDVALLLSLGADDKAREMVSDISSEPEIRALNQQFLEALILRRDGQLEEAIAKMRAILATHPQFVRVRHELAITLLGAEDWDAAGYQLVLLAGATQDGDLKNVYEDYIRALESARPWHLSGSFGVLPSTNINNATRQQIVVIGGLPFQPTQTAQSGVGVTGSLSGGYRFGLTEDLTFSLGAEGTGRFYTDHSFDHLVAGTFAELAYQGAEWRIGGGMGVERVLAGWSGYRTSVGPQGSVAFELGPTGIVSLSASARRNFYDAGGSDDEFRGGVSYTYNVSPAWSVVAGLGGARLVTEMAHNNMTGIKPWIGLATELPLGVIASARVGVEWRDYDGPIPGLTTERDEIRVEATIGGTLKELAIAGFAPRVEYTYSLNDSDTNLFDTESHSVGVTMIRAF